MRSNGHIVVLTLILIILGVAIIIAGSFFLRARHGYQKPPGRKNNSKLFY